MKNIKKKIAYWLGDKIDSRNRFPKSKKIRIGNSQADWVIPEGVIDNKSICYCVGAGLDISFDIELVEKYNCEVHIIDPTPRSRDYVKNIIATKEKSVSQRIFFHEVGIWNSDSKMKFYLPSNEEHISHSLVNLQQTQKFIEVEVRKITTLLKLNGHSKIDLLKIDIEGAEYEVVKNIIAENVRPRVMCIEFDEFHSPQDENFYLRINEIIKLLKNEGYVVINRDYPCNISFLLN